MRSKAKTVQGALAEETITLEKHGINITINGNLEIVDIGISADINQDKFGDNLKNVINQGINKAKRKMAEKMQSMGGLSNIGM